LKLVTNDYGCGTSSSILDYGIKDVVVVSEASFQHVFEQDDDLLFIGHDFLFYLWDSEEKVKMWQSYATKHELWVWCFERIDAIVPQWMQKSHYSLSIASRFCKRILACDEDDCTKYNLDWLPQWASPKFFEKRLVKPTSEKILFSGQAGGPEYHIRNVLLKNISNDDELSNIVEVTNTKRSFGWDDYINNLLRYQTILNPVGILRGLNTRAYETLISGRYLLQGAAGQYDRHEKLLKDCPSVLFFRDFQDLKSAVVSRDGLKESAQNSFEKHSLYARMKSLGVDIK
jgi:hypothetical protein